MADKERLTVYISKELKEQALELCNELSISLSGLFNVALNDYLKQNKIKYLSSVFDRFLVEELKESKEKK